MSPHDSHHGLSEIATVISESAHPALLRVQHEPLPVKHLGQLAPGWPSLPLRLVPLLLAAVWDLHLLTAGGVGRNSTHMSIHSFNRYGCITCHACTIMLLG